MMLELLKIIRISYSHIRLLVVPLYSINKLIIVKETMLRFRFVVVFCFALLSSYTLCTVHSHCAHNNHCMLVKSASTRTENRLIDKIHSKMSLMNKFHLRVSYIPNNLRLIRATFAGAPKWGGGGWGRRNPPEFWKKGDTSTWSCDIDMYICFIWSPGQ